MTTQREGAQAVAQLIYSCSGRMADEVARLELALGHAFCTLLADIVRQQGIKEFGEQEYQKIYTQEREAQDR